MNTLFQVFVAAPTPVNCQIPGTCCVSVEPYFPHYLCESFPSRDLLSKCSPGAVFFPVTVSHSLLLLFEWFCWCGNI